MRKEAPMKRMAMLMAAMLVSYAVAEQVEISLPEAGTVRLGWQAIPGQTYRVMTTTNLVDQPWQDAVPGGLVAGSVIGAFSASLPARASFYSVQKEDTNPPDVVSLVPSSDAIAVPSNATVTITLADETGINTNSIVLTIAGWEDMTLASSNVTYDDGTITFTPPDALGQAGETVTNIITVADTLGYTLSNYTWTFQLARPAEVDDDFLPLTAPPQGQGIQALAAGVPETRIRTLSNVQPMDTRAEYYIVSVSSNAVVFSYQGEPPAMPEGKRLVSFDAAHPFYRRATSNLVDEAHNRITVWTIDIPLTDLATEGSISSSAFAPADPSPLGMQVASSDFTLLHIEFGDDLSGKVLFEDGGLKLHLPQASWGFVGSVDVAFDLFFAQLRSLDASAKGTLTLDLSPEALFNQAVIGNGKFPLVQPVTKVFGAMFGVIPVWVEVIMELNAGYEYSASVSGIVNTRVHAEKELTFYVKLRQNQWTHGVHNPPIVLEADPIYWQLEGTANAKVYVQPKLTVLVYSLAGMWADIVPYAEFDGRYQLNPIEYDLGLYLGMSSTLGIESRVWYSAWGQKPAWRLFDLKWPLWTSVYPSAEGSPRFVSTLDDRAIAEDAALVLSGHASGYPPPSYRWYFNGYRIPGATSPEFTIDKANLGHAGLYSVEAYNISGSTTQKCAVTVGGLGVVVNGDFSQGNTGFYSEFTYSPTSLYPHTVYAIVDNPRSLHSGFASYGDHTTGLGLMMAVNGSASSPTVLWRQSIPIEPYRNYSFSMWVASSYADNRARLKVTINDDTVIPAFNANAPLGVWQEATATWFSDNSVSATISIVDIRGAAGGNDYAIDDISMRLIDY
jgi:hypothetical protein